MKKQELLKLWERYSLLVGMDQDDETIKEENETIATIERNLPFKDQKEHEKWLGISATFKFWEDLEELTLTIINRKREEINMRFTYKEKTFELMELKEIGTNKVYDIVTIFEVIKQGDYESYNFVNYFYGVSENMEELKSISALYIDAYIKQCQLNELLLELKKAYTNFKEDFNANNNTKGSLDDLEYAQSDLLEFVDKNL